MQFRKILAEQATKGRLNEETINNLINTYLFDVASKIAKGIKAKKVPMEKLKVTKGNTRTPLGSVDFTSYTRTDLESRVEILAHLLKQDNVYVSCNVWRVDWGVGPQRQEFNFGFREEDKEMVDLIVKHVVNSLGY